MVFMNIQHIIGSQDPIPSYYVVDSRRTQKNSYRLIERHDNGWVSHNKPLTRVPEMTNIYMELPKHIAACDFDETPIMNEFALRYCFWWTIGIIPPLPADPSHVKMLEEAIPTLRFRRDITIDYLMDPRHNFLKDRMAYGVMLRAVQGKKLSPNEKEILTGFPMFYERANIAKHPECKEKNVVEFQQSKFHLTTGYATCPSDDIYTPFAKVQNWDSHYPYVAALAAHGERDFGDPSDSSEMEMSTALFDIMRKLEEMRYYDLLWNLRWSIIDVMNVCGYGGENDSGGAVQVGNLDAAVKSGFGILSEAAYIMFCERDNPEESISNATRYTKYRHVKPFEDPAYVRFIKEKVISGECGRIVSDYEIAWAQKHGVSDVVLNFNMDGCPADLIDFILIHQLAKCLTVDP